MTQEIGLESIHKSPDSETDWIDRSKDRRPPQNLEQITGKSKRVGRTQRNIDHISLWYVIQYTARERQGFAASLTSSLIHTETGVENATETSWKAGLSYNRYATQWNAIENERERCTSVRVGVFSFLIDKIERGVE